MTEVLSVLISLGIIAIAIFLGWAIGSLLAHFSNKKWERKQRQMQLNYPVFFSKRDAFLKLQNEIYSVSSKQREIQQKILKEQELINCFPVGADRALHEDNVGKLRYSYLCYQGTYDLLNQQKKDIEQEITLTNKPESYSGWNFKES